MNDDGGTVTACEIEWSVTVSTEVRRGTTSVVRQKSRGGDEG